MRGGKAWIRKLEKRVRDLLTDRKTTVGHKCEMARLMKTQAIVRGDWPAVPIETRINLTCYSNMDRIMRTEGGGHKS